MMGFSGISDADIENLLISLSRFIDSVKEFILFDIEIFFHWCAFINSDIIFNVMILYARRYYGMEFTEYSAPYHPT